ncbi:MAG: hypothetical protein WDN69_30845 [Aliidongia sp.]
MKSFSRRDILAATTVAGAVAAVGTAAHAASFGNPDRPPEGSINAGNPNSLTNPGPQNPALADQFPSFQDPPATDINGMALFWASFNNAHKRIQSGGWAREVTQADFAISDTVSGVNMRLSAGGVRELQWHQQGRVGRDGRRQMPRHRDRRRWPAGPCGTSSRAICGTSHRACRIPCKVLGPSGAEFVLVFDNGRASEFNTLLLTDWIAHTPPEVLAENFNLPLSAFKNIPGRQSVDLPRQGAATAGPGPEGSGIAAGRAGSGVHLRNGCHGADEDDAKRNGESGG